MKAVVAAFNQEKALVRAFSVITNLRMELFQALACSLLVAGPGLGVVDVLAARVFAPTVDSLRTQNRNLLDISKISRSYGKECKDVQTC